MAVWPSAAMPVDVPPEYARPLVQWYSQKVDAKGNGNTSGPHVLCCQPECNYRFAVGDFVQRTHGKVRFEGMAIASHASSTVSRSLGLPAGVEPTPLFEYQCQSVAAPDFAIAPAPDVDLHRNADGSSRVDAGTALPACQDSWRCRGPN